MRHPLLSIILPVYNVETYLEDCLKSIIFQNTSDIEIIAVNDGSTDNSPAILEKYALQYPDIVKPFTTRNLGVSHARNTGVSRSSGDYIWFIDSDDYLTEHSMERILNTLWETDADLLLFGHYNEDQTTGRRKKILTSYSSDILDGQSQNCCSLHFSENKYELARMSPYPWDRVIRRTLWGTLKYPEGIRFEDLPPVFLTAARAGKIVYIPECLYVYRTHVGFLKSFSEGMLDLPQALDNMRQLFQQYELFDSYRDVLEFLAVKSCLQRFNQLVITYDRSNRPLKYNVIHQYFDYLNQTWPNWKSSPLIPEYLDPLQKKLRRIYCSRKRMLFLAYVLTSPIAVFQKLLLRLKR